MRIKITKLFINIDSSNIIKANNNNNRVEISSHTEVFENNYVEKTTIINHNKNDNKKYIEGNKIKKIENTGNNEEEILKKALNKKNTENNMSLNTCNYKYNYEKVNNNNNQKVGSKTELSIKNCDIKITNEINPKIIKPNDIDIDINCNIKKIILIMSKLN